MMLYDNLYKETIKYKEFQGKSESGTNKFGDVQEIPCLRLKGYRKVTVGSDGDSVSTSIQYRTPFKLVKGSKLGEYEVMESVAVDSPLPNAGFINYLK